MSTTTWGWLVLAFPLAGTIIIGLGHKRLGRGPAGAIGTLAILLAFVCAVGSLISLQDHPEDQRQLVSSLWDYAVTGSIDARLSILIDPLSVFMMLVITGVSTLIHLYSISYMKSDRGNARYFAYLNFFVFSMLVLVTAANFMLLIVGWAFVGAASYLLISFWFRRETATRAGIKAFVINVVGDVGLVLGTFFILRHSGTLDFLGTFRAVDDGAFATHNGALVAGCLLLLVGAFAKSAQIPFHTWLPDAMEGPTPVSSLIHAATMVTAGVYLISRMHPLFEHAPAAANVGAIVGAVTLFVAGTIALVQTDIKRVIAYSTMSQIGYMIMGVSAGAYAAGMFHLLTHAFFKALLFMAAGSIIGAMAGSQSLDKMSGFKRSMPFTFGCFVVGGLALSGVPPFSGFFSKDEILAFVGDRGGWFVALYVVGYVGAFLTGIYTWRMIFRAFFGRPVPEAVELEHGHIAHAEQPTNPANGEVEDTDVGFPGPEHVVAEREIPMKVAMGILALGATFLGVLQIPMVTHVITTFLEPTFEDSKYLHVEPSDGLVWFGMILGTVVALTGIAIAHYIWVRKPGTSAAIQARFKGLHTFLFHKWYFDELIDLLVVRPWSAVGSFARTWFERVIVDGVFVGGATGIVKAGSSAVRALQTGFLRYYAALLLLGGAAVVLYFLIASS
ncbi:NADH-quinone oxidoreductase subunit L [Conexibacter sp. CPCC 206217]|uniref:NADH-quinone oxidoreductase subunit L n=1 Tax=Conexibacter sp. CPCC 206217 TaxID=3064574 RepID=UPI002715EF20|nr:NADH-quinone oxidoreductase subunit L [Conexibacter sp. CPCC 206217]MDO8211951.1 NADH-quinone oxidoreductase subunit L [Conexibacter sp. CPCC 206217]